MDINQPKTKILIALMSCPFGKRDQLINVKSSKKSEYLLYLKNGFSRRISVDNH